MNKTLFFFKYHFTSRNSPTDSPSFHKFDISGATTQLIFIYSFFILYNLITTIALHVAPYSYLSPLSCLLLLLLSFLTAERGGLACIMSSFVLCCRLIVKKEKEERVKRKRAVSEGDCGRGEVGDSR